MTASLPHLRIPRATYRLQLHRDFDFDAARALLPYLHRLGISHVYCSPIATATAGSRHGYDVVDPTRISPELGGREGFERLSAAARALGLGLLLDQVPNHMGVFSPDNAWWNELLEHGEASPYARFYDIDWQPVDPSMAGKVLLPVLGASYGETLERGELALAFDPSRGGFAFVYGDHRLPVDPRSVSALVGAALPGNPLGAELAALPARVPEAVGRVEAARALQQRLARLAVDPVVATALADQVAAVNAAPDRDALDALHEAQAYRLSHWSTAGDEINYRRFFDVNALAALRIEDPVVFETTQQLALDLAADGWVDGLRIDHPDGLLDPGDYFERLQRGYRERVAARTGRPPADLPSTDARPASALYVVAEKIAAGFEGLPIHWPLHGATGYRFAALVNGVFVERRNAGRMDRLWRLYGGVATPYAEIVRVAKRRAARVALGAQANALAHRLRRIARSSRTGRDFGLAALRFAIVEVATAMPVYRTYVAPSGAASAQDERFVGWAVAQAEREGELPDPALFEFVRRALLGEPPPGASTETADAVRRFALMFQQYSSPVAAKGVEDTAFYRYHRLVSLNEVGGDPAVFGISAAAFHGAAADRAKHWPHTMLATSTHDNKRAEDVRARIDVLSEQPKEWHRALRRWRTGTRSFTARVDGHEAPSPADQYLLHQTLLGSLPAGGLADATLAAYRDRIEAYVLKAACEAKVDTSWTRRNPAYEAALVGFVRHLLGRVDANPVLADLQARATELAWYGALNSVAMTVLKTTSPGVPDLYQGTELIDLSLVDPDNRRPVDYDLRRRLLDSFDGPAAPAPVELAADPTDGRLKLWVVWRLLRLRRDDPTLFDGARYEPLEVRGARRRHVLAFALHAAGSTLVVAVGRKFAGLGAPGRLPVGGEVWGDTRIARPQPLADDAGVVDAGVVDALTGSRPTPAAGDLAVAELFVALPFAALRFAGPPPAAPR